MRQAVLLRGINLGSHNRIAMPDLRRRLGDAGYQDVSTYLASGNVVVSSELDPPALAEEFERYILDWYGLELSVIVRTGEELAAVVALNPLGEVASDPKRYQVSFLREPLSSNVVARLEDLAASPEQVVVSGREVYAWHPAGVARSKLWNELAGKRLAVPATARNWTTVGKLLEMAEG